ncbi:MFS transporter [Phenylobacterium sp.]|jgi:PAT family beta-lactamase induction signal transducer AmpG|uniref:MFS transporter n=1 Tax=Phenylobacterium sp. TaxID=1871053 RepID=UPI002F417D7A
MEALADERPKLVWLMGFTNATYGFAYAVVLVTIPQLLAARGVAEPVIAGLTGLATAMALATFAIAPILDTLVSRRTWTVALALGSAALTFLVLAMPKASSMLAPVLAIDALVISLYNAAIGGWLGAGLPKSCDATIGTWFAIGNSFGFGLGAVSQYWLMTHLPTTFGAAAIAGLALAPLAIIRFFPAADAGRKAVRESFKRLAVDVAQLARRPQVLRIILMFALPCAAFTLTNAFGGIGRDFHASDSLVDVANGVGATLIGLVASLAARQLLRRAPAPLAYLGVGSLGAAFTLSLLALPRTPATYLLAVIGENAAQSVAQVSQNAIIFRSIQEGSPLASSQFGLLGTAAVLPYAYMQMLDGYGYKLAGDVSGSFLMDALVSLTACALLALPVLGWLRAGRLETAAVPEKLAV